MKNKLLDEVSENGKIKFQIECEQPGCFQAGWIDLEEDYELEDFRKRIVKGLVVWRCRRHPQQFDTSKL